VMEIDGASNTGVDNVRENIIAAARIAPQSRRKIFIIDEVHMLSLSAFNALLKIIEEPPAQVTFILCTTEIHKVPATIISRCERFDFKRISVAEVVKKLNLISSREKVEIDPAILEAIARQANGYMRDAESLLGQVMALGGRKITSDQAELILPNYNSQEIFDFLEYLKQKDAAKAIKAINRLVDNGINLKNFTNELVNILRKMIFNQINPGLASSLGLDFGEALEAKVANLGAAYNLDQLLYIIREFLNVQTAPANIFISQLPLELAVIKICGDYQPESAIAAGPGKAMVEKKTNNPTSSSAANNRSVSPGAGDNKAKGPLLSLDYQALKDRWPELLIKIKKYNHSLSFVLQNCQASSVKDNVLNLVFKYKFHKDRINDPQIKNLVISALKEVFGVTLELETSVDETLNLNSINDQATESNPMSAVTKSETASSAPAQSVPSVEESGLLGNLLQTFGGEVIS